MCCLVTCKTFASFVTIFPCGEEITIQQIGHFSVKHKLLNINILYSKIGHFSVKHKLLNINDLYIHVIKSVSLADIL